MIQTKHPITALLTCFHLLGACASTPKNGTASQTTPPIQVGLLQPQQAGFGQPIGGPLLQGTILVGPGMLDLCHTTSSSSFLREGPGVQFKWLSFQIDQTQPLIRLDQTGSWVKVLLLHKNLRGWIHSKSLSKMSKNATSLSIRTSNLSTATLATTKVRLYLKPNSKPQLVDSKKGQVVTKLTAQSNKALILLPKSRSLAWVDQRDIR